MPLLLDRRMLLAFGAAAALPLSQARAQTPPESAADRAFDQLAADWLAASLWLSPIAASLWGDHR